MCATQTCHILCWGLILPHRISPRDYQLLSTLFANTLPCIPTYDITCQYGRHAAQVDGEAIERWWSDMNQVHAESPGGEVVEHAESSGGEVVEHAESFGGEVVEKS